MGCRSLLFITLNTSCQSFLACKFLLRNQLTVIWGLLCRYISVAAFKILSLSLTFGILIMICLGVGLCGSILFGILCTSWTWMCISFTKLGKFSFLFFQINFQFLPLLLFMNTNDSDVAMFGYVPQSYTIFIFLNLCFFFLFWLNVYFFLMLLPVLQGFAQHSPVSSLSPTPHI